MDRPKVPADDTSSSWRQSFKLLMAAVAAAGLFGLGLYVGRNGHSAATNQLDYSSVNQVYSLLKNDFDGSLDTSKLNDGLKSGLVAATGDPYTVYFNPKDAATFNEQLTGSFTGIGAELGTDAKNNIVIVAPLAGSPAEAAGLKASDEIAKVDGQSTAGLAIDQVVSKIRGAAGSKVSLTIVRAGGQPFDVTITRTQINVPSVKSQIDGLVGYLKISQFGPDTTKLAQAAADDFKAKGVKAVVVDLRGDPGGYLDSAVAVASFWLDRGQTVVSERRGDTVINSLTANGNNLLHGLPTAVLIDGGSASEILAGALHDNHVAQTVGAKSFGKGSVQQVENLSGGGELKVTVARWYTPAGKNIDKQGITPDTIVETAATAGGPDPQKDKAYLLVQAQIH